MDDAWQSEKVQNCNKTSHLEYLGSLSAPEHAGLRITSFVRIDLVSESGFGEKEPPPSTPEQAGLRIGSLVGIEI